jgi:hypothetical protein
MTKEEGSVQLADAAWTLRGASAKSHSINFPHPGGSGWQVTYNPCFSGSSAPSLVSVEINDFRIDDNPYGGKVRFGLSKTRMWREPVRVLKGYKDILVKLKELRD